MIEIRNLNVDYFGNSALENVNIDIPFGYAIGIIGPNGAGKSTFIKSLLEVIKKRTGSVMVEEKIFLSTNGRSHMCRKKMTLIFLFQSR